ncbi:cellulase family glycosylhydrolase [Candidatus Saccharibacteria bacterium]|nr:cellulase family glycosylhydrolase [Candidatus Saccharibacteria bacterium]
MRPEQKQKKYTKSHRLTKLSAATLVAALAAGLAPELGYPTNDTTAAARQPAKELVVKPNSRKSPEKLIDRRIGIGVHFNCVPMNLEERQLVYRSLEDNHIGWARINLNWNDLEPNTKGSWDTKILDSLDDCIIRAKDNNVRPLIVFQGSPGWANGGKDWTNPPNDSADYANALSFLAKRYKGIVKGWEIWNEPNLDDKFWRGSPQQMVELMKAAYPAVKEADPKAYVLMPGIVLNKPNYLTYLKELYEAGASNYFDILSIHGYLPSRQINDGLQAMIKTSEASGDTKKPVWLTEFAVPVSGYTTEEDQAKYAAEVLKLISANLRVKAAFWFQAKDAGSGDGWEKGVAAINSDGRPRPVLAALGKAASGTK